MRTGGSAQDSRQARRHGGGTRSMVWPAWASWPMTSMLDRGSGGSSPSMVSHIDPSDLQRAGYVDVYQFLAWSMPHAAIMAAFRASLWRLVKTLVIMVTSKKNCWATCWRFNQMRHLTLLLEPVLPCKHMGRTGYRQSSYRMSSRWKTSYDLSAHDNLILEPPHHVWWQGHSKELTDIVHLILEKMTAMILISHSS